MSEFDLAFTSQYGSQPSSMAMPERARTVFAEKAAKIFGDLSRRRPDETMSEADIVLIFVHYLFGVVATALPDAEPDETLGLLVELAEGSVTVADATQALRRSPPPIDTSVGRVIRGAEVLGRRDAEAILASLGPTDHVRTSEPTTTVLSAAPTNTIKPDQKGETP